MEPPAGGHVQVSRLFEPGSAGVRQAQLVQQDQSVQWQAVLTYDELFDARQAANCVGFDVLPSLPTLRQQLGQPWPHAWDSLAANPMVARIEERCADIQHAQLVEMLRRKAKRRRVQPLSTTTPPPTISAHPTPSTTTPHPPPPRRTLRSRTKQQHTASPSWLQSSDHEASVDTSTSSDMYTPSHSIHTNADDATSSDDLQHAPAQEVSSMRCHTVGAGNTERDTSSMHHGAQGHGENRGEGSGHPGSGGVGGNAWKPLHRNAWLKQQVGALLQSCDIQHTNLTQLAQRLVTFSGTHGPPAPIPTVQELQAVVQCVLDRKERVRHAEQQHAQQQQRHVVGQQAQGGYGDGGYVTAHDGGYGAAQEGITAGGDAICYASTVEAQRTSLLMSALDAVNTNDTDALSSLYHCIEGQVAVLVHASASHAASHVQPAAPGVSSPAAPTSSPAAPTSSPAAPRSSSPAPTTQQHVATPIPTTPGVPSTAAPTTTAPSPTTIAQASCVVGGAGSAFRVVNRTVNRTVNNTPVVNSRGEEPHHDGQRITQQEAARATDIVSYMLASVLNTPRKQTHGPHSSVKHKPSRLRPLILPTSSTLLFQHDHAHPLLFNSMLTANPVLTATHTAGLPSSGQQHGQQTQIQTQQTQAAAPNQHNVVMCVSRGRGLGYHHKAGALAAAAHRVKRAYRVPGSIIWPAAARGVWPQRIRLPRLVHPRYASPLHSSSRHTTSPGAPTLPTPPPPPLVTAAAATPGATRATPGATRATVGAAAPGAAGGSLNTPGIHINPLSTSTPLPISTPPVQRPPPSAPTPPHDASHDASPLRPGLVVQQALENAAGGLENERGHGLAGGASVGVGPPGTPGRSWLGVTQGGVGVGSQGTREQREQVERDEAIVRQLLPLGLFRPRYILKHIMKDQSGCWVVHNTPPPTVPPLYTPAHTNTNNYATANFNNDDTNINNDNTINNDTNTINNNNNTINNNTKEGFSHWEQAAMELMRQTQYVIPVQHPRGGQQQQQRHMGIHVVTPNAQATPVVVHFINAIRLKYFLWEELCIAAGTLQPAVGGIKRKKRKRQHRTGGQHDNGGQHEPASTSPPAPPQPVAAAEVSRKSSTHNPNRRLPLRVVLPPRSTVVFETFRTTAAAYLASEEATQLVHALHTGQPWTLQPLASLLDNPHAAMHAMHAMQHPAAPRPARQQPPQQQQQQQEQSHPTLQAIPTCVREGHVQREAIGGWVDDDVHNVFRVASQLGVSHAALQAAAHQLQQILHEDTSGVLG